MLEELVWLVIFAICVTIATIMIKILIEFPGVLKFKCIYREEETSNNDFEEVVDVDVEQIMKHYENQMRKKKIRTKSRVSLSCESESELDIIRKVHKHKHKHKNKDVKQIEKNFNEKEISIEVDDEKLACIPSEIPHQLTITVNDNNSDTVDNNNLSQKRVSQLNLKTVAVIEHHENPPAIEITAHSKHGHVRQH